MTGEIVGRRGVDEQFGDVASSVIMQCSNCHLFLPLASEARLDASDTASPTAALAFPKAESIVVWITTFF